MAIYLDDERLEAPCATWGSLLEVAQARVATSRRVIVEVREGDRVLSAADLESRRGDELGGAEIRIYSADLSELAASALRQIIARLDEAREAQARAADLIQRGQTKEAMAPIALAIEAWQQVHAGVAQVMQGFAIEPASVMSDGITLAAFLPGMVTALRGLRDMLSLNDWVGVADALGHEWAEMIDRGQTLIAELARRVADGK